MERDITVMTDTIMNFDTPERPNIARVPGMAKRKIIGHGEPALSLAKLLQKAAGLDGFQLRSIECRIHCKEAVIFTAEIYGTAEDVAAAVAANQE